MIYYIYTLSHPITNEIRYVGKTVNLKNRYKQHLYDKITSHKANWVQSLRKDNLKPILAVIEECTKDNWEEREIYWISQYDNLTNHRKGGQGNSDYVQITSEETRKKLSEAHKGRKLSAEQKQKIKQNSKPKRKVLINGIEYESLMEASRQLNLKPNIILSRLKTKKQINYIYLT